MHEFAKKSISKGGASKPRDLLEAAGQALYGERWLMRLGRDLNISEDTISKWMKGRMSLPMAHGALKETESFLRAKAAELLNVADQISEARADLSED